MADGIPKDVLADPAATLMLELFLADAEGRQITARVVSDKHEVSDSTMSRWLAHLSQAGLIVGDGDGNLDDRVTLSGCAMSQLETALDRAAEPLGKKLDVDPA